MPAPLWRGLIEEYRELLPVSASTQVVTLLEGATPLLHADRLSEELGADVWLKVGSPAAPTRPSAGSATVLAAR